MGERWQVVGVGRAAGTRRADDRVLSLYVISPTPKQQGTPARRIGSDQRAPYVVGLLPGNAGPKMVGQILNPHSHNTLSYMASADPKDRAAVVCDNCQNIYVVRIRDDGELEPIGIPSECRDCGEAAFTVLGEDRKANPSTAV